MRHHRLFTTAAAAAFIAGAAIAQSTATETKSKPESGWAAPGTPGSSIKGEYFHAQVLLDVAGFSPGAIDGAHRQFTDRGPARIPGGEWARRHRQARVATKRALLRNDRPSTVTVSLSEEDVGGPFTYPMPTKPEAQEKLGFLGYRNMLEKLAERYHTTPQTIVALNGPDKLIGMGQTLKLPNVVPQSRDYDGAIDKQAPLLAAFNVDANQRKGDFVVVDKSEGTLKVL